MTFLDDFVVFDLETTGVDPHRDRIVTAYLGQMNRRGEIVQEASFVIDPMVPIPEAASRIHGYTIDRARAEANSTPYELVTWLHAVLAHEASNGRPVGGYNLQYDLTMLEAERARWTPGVAPLQFHDPISAQNGLLVLDGFVIDKKIDQWRSGSRKLVDTARFYSVHLSATEAHGARADAIASGRVILQQFGRSQMLARTPLETLHQRQIGWKAEQAASLQAWLRSNGEPDAIVAGEWPTFPSPTTHPNERTAA